MVRKTKSKEMDKRPVANKRRKIDLAFKLKVLKMFEEGKRMMEIARACILGESSVRCIRKNETKIKA